MIQPQDYESDHLFIEFVEEEKKIRNSARSSKSNPDKNKDDDDELVKEAAKMKMKKIKSTAHQRFRFE